MVSPFLLRPHFSDAAPQGMKVTLKTYSDKNEYIFRELRRGRGSRIITQEAIERVLSHPPKNPKKITIRDINRLNKGLLVPMATETIAEIIRIGKNFDRLLVDAESGMKKAPHSVKVYETLPTAS